jgi:hypothetical protein
VSVLLREQLVAESAQGHTRFDVAAFCREARASLLAGDGGEDGDARPFWYIAVGKLCFPCKLCCKVICWPARFMPSCAPSQINWDGTIREEPGAQQTPPPPQR